MIKLLSLFQHRALQQFADSQEIHDEQFMDKNGRVHMDTYLSYYDRETSMVAAINEATFADNYISSLYSTPFVADERRWEQAPGTTRYEGGLKSFTVNPGIKRIGVKAFSYNINMNDISLPEGLEIIDREAFSVCTSLSRITIPSSVIYIGKDAFDNKVETLIILCDNPPEITSLGVNKDCKIYVPHNSNNLYRNDQHWKKYAKQIIDV